jgi:DNA-binding transcriptional MerR regulator
MGQNEPIRRNTHTTGPRGAASEIPDKLYFRIGEVARLCEVPAYVLRFWESEFPQLKPNKGGTGQRLYRRRDVEMALRVKCLLYDEGYTIPGARQIIKSELKHKEPQLPLAGVGVPDAKQLHGLRRELEAIVAILSHPVGKSRAPAIHPIRGQKRAAPRSSGLATAPGIPFDNPPAPKADRK